MNALFFALLSFIDPCEIRVTEPISIYTDGIDIQTDDGRSLIGCAVIVEPRGELTIEAEQSVEITTPRGPVYLGVGESIPIESDGAYSVGYVADPDDPVPVDVCCYPVLWEDEIIWVCYSCPDAPKVRSMNVISVPCAGMTGPAGGWIDDCW
jgi:hypothetical protein